MSNTRKTEGTPIDLDKMRSIGVLKGGRSRARTVKEYRRKDGIRVKATTDENGNTVTEHATKDDRVDVLLKPKTVVFGQAELTSPRVEAEE